MQEELLFCPLGGSGEIGMNMNLFAYGKPDNQKWIMVDIGVTFADDSLPGIDLIYPDPGFIIDKKDDLLGIVLTHAHEDHIGAIAHIWPQIKCKIFSTPFTAVLIKEKFKEKRIDIGNNLKIVDLNGKVNLHPFNIEFITLTHSILEPNGLRIETPAGVILHTGDWKVDPNPLIGGKINSDRLKEIGDEGVLAMICDSTNVFSIGKSGSELDVAGEFAFGHYTHEKNPVTAKAALTTIEIIEQEGLVENAAELGKYMLEQLNLLKAKHSTIGDVRGRGLLVGVELVLNQEEKTPANDLAEDVLYRCLSKGLSFKLTMGNVMTLTPPLIIKKAQIDLSLEIIDQSLSEAEQAF